MFVAGPRRRGAGAARRRAWGRSLPPGGAHRGWRACPATPICSARNRCTLGHHLLAWFWMLRRDVDALRCRRPPPPAAMPSGLRSAGRTELGDRPACRGHGARLRPRQSRTRSTPSPTATSRSTTCPRPRSAQPTFRGSAPRSSSGRRASSGSAEPARGVQLRLVDHAAEDEPRRRRAVAGQGATGRRPR